MARRTRNRDRPTTGTLSLQDVPTGQSSQTGEPERLDANTGGISGSLSSGKGKTEKGRSIQTPTSTSRKEGDSDATGSEGSIGETECEVVYQTDEIRLTREPIQGGWLFTKEYFTHDIFRNRKLIEHVAMAFKPE
ncbi:hypothetical protein [uncultured Mediterranean phage uvMED]|nr:hypothetical protein [uncultured Mediterranean phage uvMED]